MILLAHSIHLGVVATFQSPVWDEVAHLPAGISHWDMGRFDLYRVNPPLPRMVAAVPVLWSAKRNWSGYSSNVHERPDFIVGEDFINANGRDSIRLFFMARWMSISFSILGACVCFFWARELYGYPSGIMAMLLWCLSPNITAWGSVVMPDLPAAACGIFAMYQYWRWLRAGSWRRAYWSGFSLGLALLTKLTWVMLIVLLPVFWLVVCGCRLIPQGDAQETSKEKPSFNQLIFVLATGCFVLNLGYGFEATMQPVGEFEFRSKSLAGDMSDTANSKTGNRFRESILGQAPVPLPKNYLYGIDYIKWEYEREYKSYLRGEWKKGGWWYYYLYAILIKVPIATLILGCFCLAASLSDSKPLNLKVFDELLLLCPAVLLFYTVSSQTGFNHHMRYVLPSFPFFFVWVAKLGRYIAPDFPIKRPFVIAMLFAIAISSISIFPNYIAFFNCTVGARNGHKHLLNSNIDFGQGLLALKAWKEDNPNKQPFILDYAVTLVDPSIVGIEHEKYDPEVERKAGWYAFSLNNLYLRDELADLRTRSPDHVVAHSIYLFEIK